MKTVYIYLELKELDILFNKSTSDHVTLVQLFIQLKHIRILIV